MTDPQPQPPPSQDLQKAIQPLIERMAQIEDRMDALAERMGRLAKATGPAAAGQEHAQAPALGPAQPPGRPPAQPAEPPKKGAVPALELQALAEQGVGPRGPSAPPAQPAEPPSIWLVGGNEKVPPAATARPKPPRIPPAGRPELTPAAAAAAAAAQAAATRLAAAATTAGRGAGIDRGTGILPVRPTGVPPVAKEQGQDAPATHGRDAHATAAAAKPAVAKPAASAAPRVSLEQRIGLKWMLLVGLGVLILSVIFFYQYAVTQGWINERVRLGIGTLAGLAMLGVGRWAFRRGLKFWAGAVIGGGIVLLYSVVFLASPNGPPPYRLFDSTAVAFALMCLVTLIGVAMSLWTSLLVTAVVALVGAMATPLLLSTGQNRQVELMGYLLAVDAGFLAVAALRRWQVLAPLALAGTVILFAGWYHRFYPAEPTIWTTSAFGWAFFALFAAYAVVAGLTGRAHATLAIALSVLAALLMGILARAACGGSGDFRWGFCLQLAVLEALTLAAAYAIRRPHFAPFILIGGSILFAAWYVPLFAASPMTDAVTLMAWLHVAMFVAFCLAGRDQLEPNVVRLLLLAAAAGGGTVLLAGWGGSGEAAWRWSFCLQLALLELLTLAVAYALRDSLLAPFILIGSSILLAAWYVPLHRAWPMADAATALAWLHVGLFAAFCLAQRRLLSQGLADLLLLGAASGSGLVFLSAWGQSADLRWPFCLQLALLELLVLSAGYVLPGPLVAPWTLMGTSGLFALWYVPLYPGGPMTDSVLTLAWLHVAMFVAYCLAESRRQPAWAFLPENISGPVDKERVEPEPEMTALPVPKDLPGLLLVGAALAAGAAIVPACNQLALWPLLAGQLLVLVVGLFAVAAWQDWPALTLLTVLVGQNVMLGWFSYRYDASAVAPVCGYCWCIAALASAAALWINRPHWNWFHAGNLLLVGFVSAVAWSGMRQDMPAAAYMAQVLVLDVLALAFCWIRNWPHLRIAVLVWTAHALLLTVWQVDDPWFISGWVWTFYALFTGDLLARAVLGRREGPTWLESSLATAATGLMYASTYYVLHGPYQAWMGLYTAAWGAAAIAVGCLLLLRCRRYVLAHAYIGQGLVLVTMAVPLQFDFSAVTIAWAAQGVVAAFLARRLRSWMLLLKCPIVLALTVGHFLIIELPHDRTVTHTVFELFATPVSYSLILAAVLTVALLVSSVLVRGSRILTDSQDEWALAALFVTAGTWLYFSRAAQELPATACTWWWLVYAAVILGFAAWRRGVRIFTIGSALLALTMGKWLLIDTLGSGLEHRYHPLDLPVVNWQMAAGLAMAALLLWMRRTLARLKADLRSAAAFVENLWLPLAAFLVLWGGSFEINRYFSLPFGHDLPNRAQAMQMAYSLWWALCAGGCLVAGFALTHAVLRYLAIVVFGVTLVKVFLVDLQHVQAVFRILSFMGLGLLLLAGSYLYHVKFRKALAPPTTLDVTAAPESPAQEPAAAEHDEQP